MPNAAGLVFSRLVFFASDWGHFGNRLGVFTNDLGIFSNRLGVFTNDLGLFANRLGIFANKLPGSIQRAVSTPINAETYFDQATLNWFFNEF